MGGVGLLVVLGSMICRRDSGRDPEKVCREFKGSANKAYTRSIHGL